MGRIRLSGIALGIVLGAGCGNEVDLGAIDASRSAIVNGSRDPLNTFLTAEQVLAVGYLANWTGKSFCTGTVIAPRVVATARHCVWGLNPVDLTFGLGEQPSDPDAILPVVDIRIHPDRALDFALLILGVDPNDVLPGVTPISLNRELIDESWRGRWVDAAGYGETFSSATGRFFASVEIVDWDESTINVYGHEEQGICYGDSGGPILWQPAAETPPLLVGTEQGGEGTCVGNDYLSRVELTVTWVDQELAEPLPPPLQPCGEIDFLGECQGSEMVWCMIGYLHREDCELRDAVCGWLGPDWGAQCLPSSCGEIDYFGQCEGALLKRCRHQGLYTHDCADDNLQCLWVDDETGFDCGGCSQCGGECVDLSISLAHCGACDRACAPPHARGVCEEGVCAIESCRVGYQDLDGYLVNGCEFATGSPEGCGCTTSRPSTLGWLGLVCGCLLWRRRRAKLR